MSMIRGIKNPLYINANIMYGECLKIIQKRSWKRRIKTGDLARLSTHYSYVTSELTKFEVLQRLQFEENLSLKDSAKVFLEVKETFLIKVLYNVYNLQILTSDFFSRAVKYQLSFPDAVHIMVAKKLRIPLVTHDKQMLKQLSRHENKKKFYEFVYKPQDLIS